jgi:hypothetical protein
LNCPTHLSIIDDIGANVDFAVTAIQSCDYGLFAAAIQNGWALNQRLDSGTNAWPHVMPAVTRKSRFGSNAQTGEAGLTVGS